MGNRSPSQLELVDQSQPAAVISLIPSQEDAKALTIPNGHRAERLHITLRFLGDATTFDKESRTRIVEGIREAAAGHGPIEGIAGGISVLGPTSPKTSQALLFSGDDLGLLHADVLHKIDTMALS
ncbi:MAG: hypothetical protein H0T78_07525, partial [Longispora sp.]|nr:hypothetical protein [Longispora sp. (in: high G+C Gram-positive bacteria)]